MAKRDMSDRRRCNVAFRDRYQAASIAYDIAQMGKRADKKRPAAALHYYQVAVKIYKAAKVTKEAWGPLEIRIRELRAAFKGMRAANAKTEG